MPCVSLVDDRLADRRDFESSFLVVEVVVDLVG